MDEKKLIIVGAGETAQIAFEYFSNFSDFTVCAFSVEERYLADKSLFSLPVVALERVEQEYPTDIFSAFVAVSSTGLNRVRKKLYQLVEDEANERWELHISPLQ